MNHSVIPAEAGIQRWLDSVRLLAQFFFVPLPHPRIKEKYFAHVRFEAACNHFRGFSLNLLRLAGLRRAVNGVDDLEHVEGFSRGDRMGSDAHGAVHGCAHQAVVRGLRVGLVGES